MRVPGSRCTSDGAAAAAAAAAAASSRFRFFSFFCLGPASASLAAPTTCALKAAVYGQTPAQFGSIMLGGRRHSARGRGPAAARTWAKAAFTFLAFFTFGGFCTPKV